MNKNKEIDDLRIRMAGFNDLDDLTLMYKIAVRHMEKEMEKAGVPVPSDLIPTKEKIGDGILAGGMYIAASKKVPGGIAAAFTLGRTQPAGSEKAKWQYNGDNVTVVDSFCVNKDYQGMGIGKAILVTIEASEKEEGTAAVRLAADENNKRAAALIKSCGFKKAGTAEVKGSSKDLYEKVL